jgi:hypothetical protein
MTDDFLSFIEVRRTKIRRQIQRLENALVELDKSEKLYRMSQKSDVPKAALDLPSGSGGSAPPPQAGVSKISQGLVITLGTTTIKQAVLDLLQEHPDGLTAEDILTKLNAGPLPNLVRSSLSPQLSRLRHIDGAIDFQGGWWRVAKKDDAEGGSHPPSAANGAGALPASAQ